MRSLSIDIFGDLNSYVVEVAKPKIKLSCCAWALDEGTGEERLERRSNGTRVAEAGIFGQLADLGFEGIDICPSMLKSKDSQIALEKLRLGVGCVSISHDAPAGSTFDSDDPDRVLPLIEHTNFAVNHAAAVGADWAYVVPGPFIDEKTRSNYTDKLVALADYAEQREVKLGIEHFPGTAFATVSSTLDFVNDVGHPNFFLLFDIGHAQMTNEDPAVVLSKTGDRLGYVHLDDNDGVGDLHLALTDGIQTQESLEEFFRLLEDIGYSGSVSLEMNKTLPNPKDAIRRSKAIVERFIDPG